MEQERDRALEHIANLVDESKFDEAKVTKGGLNMCRMLWTALHPPERPIAEAETPYVDPATITSSAAMPLKIVNS